MSLPTIVAHRGFHHVAAENTVEAFTAAVAAGVRWVECDVWFSADGVPVVLHDQTLEGATSGHGRVGDHSLADLKKFHIPSLWDVLGAITDETGILIEIKPPMAAALVTTVRAEVQHFPGPWMIQSFHFENIDSTEWSAALVKDAASLQQALEGPWQNVHADHVLLNTFLVEQMHSQGKKVGAWTVNGPAEIQRMLDLGVDMLITDEPVLAGQIIARK